MEEEFASELDKYEYFLKDELERSEKCEDEYTKQLLLNRVRMWQNVIHDLKERGRV